MPFRSCWRCAMLCLCAHWAYSTLGSSVTATMRAISQINRCARRMDSRLMLHPDMDSDLSCPGSGTGRNIESLREIRNRLIYIDYSGYSSYLNCPYNPPVTRRLAPVTYDAPSDVKNITADATSSAVPARCIGARFAPASSRPGRCISVAIGPGDTALTRIPSPATSRASPLVRLSTPPLEAAYHTNSFADP